jgi:hypothetical protein
MLTLGFLAPTNQENTMLLLKVLQMMEKFVWEVQLSR